MSKGCCDPVSSSATPTSRALADAAAAVGAEDVVAVAVTVAEDAAAAVEPAVAAGTRPKSLTEQVVQDGAQIAPRLYFGSSPIFDRSNLTIFA